jgi:SnoaL-like domain
MTTSTAIIEMLLRRNLFDVFDQRDAAKRRAAIRELFFEDGIFSDPDARHVGHDAIDGAVAALHQRLPGYTFKEFGTPQTLQDSGRLAWAFGPPEDPERVTGLDIIVVRGDRIAALYAFLDKPPA